MEAGQQSEEGVSMGSAAVIVINVLLALSAFCAWKWRSEYKRARFAINHAADLDKLLTTAGERNAQLEAEILRLRNNSLTPPPEKVDNSVIKAKSSADVRRLTEAAFGVQPEIGEHLENE
jgi:hypothetical protein